MPYNQFGVYQCSSCQRQIEIQQDATSPGPTRCTITYKCPGLLSLVTTRSVRTEMFPPIVYGLQDYIQRGTVLDNQASTTVTIQQINLMNSAAGSLVLAGPLKDTSQGTNHFYFKAADGSTAYTEDLTLNPLQLPVTTSVTLYLYELTADILSYSQYVYNVGANTQFVQGADDSPQGLNLFFSSTDTVRVYVNGVELTSSQFNTDTPNQVTFTPLLTNTSNVVDVYVYQDISSAISTATPVPITFVPLNVGTPADLANREVNSWGDIGSVIMTGTEKFLLYCTNLGALDPSASYGIINATTVTSTGAVVDLDLTQLDLLISYPPYGFADKDLTHYAVLGSIATGDGVLTLGVGSQTGLPQITCTQDYITSTFNSMTPGVQVSGVVSQDASGTTLTITPITNTYILGPS